MSSCALRQELVIKRIFEVTGTVFSILFLLVMTLILLNHSLYCAPDRDSKLKCCFVHLVFNFQLHPVWAEITESMPWRTCVNIKQRFIFTREKDSYTSASRCSLLVQK